MARKEKWTWQKISVTAREAAIVNTAKQAAKEVVQAVVTKGASIGGKGGGGISLSGEAKDMMAASKQLAGASAAPSREHLVAKPDLSR